MRRASVSPSATGIITAVDPLVGEDHVVERHDRFGVGVWSRCQHPAVLQHVVDHDHAAGPHPGHQRSSQYIG